MEGEANLFWFFINYIQNIQLFYRYRMNRTNYFFYFHIILKSSHILSAYFITIIFRSCFYIPRIHQSNSGWMIVIIYRNRVKMEKTKSSITQSMRFGSRNKLNISTHNVKGVKSSEVSLIKHKQKKTSLKNIIKTAFMSKKSSKKNNDSILYKTSVNSPAQTTALFSCISTPNSRSQKKTFLRKIVRGEGDISKQITKEIIEDNSRFSDESMKITFIINQKTIIEKYFNYSQNLDEVKKTLIKQIVKKNEKLKFYVAFLGFYTVQCNIGVDKMLKNPNLLLSQFRDRGFHTLHLKVLLAKKQPNYSNLEFCDFKLIKYLGSGGFSSVYLARCMVDGTLCALKFIKKSSIVSENKYKMLENQKNILFTIDHTRLVDLYYAIQSKNYIIFGLQYCPNGNLYQLIQKRKLITQSEAKFLFSQILQGLHSLHTQKILFRDMKLENILFDQNGNVKITDFGLSKPDINKDDVTYSYCGSPQYMAPEMLAKTGHSYQIDYYALGILLYELLYGHSPFFAAKKQDIFNAILNSQPHFPKNPLISKQVKSLIKGLLQKNPKHRIGSLKGTQQIRCHPWLRGYSTQNMQSPFKNSYSNQNIKLKQNIEQQKILNQFTQDLKTTCKQKVFFNRSFINKRLVDKLQEFVIPLYIKPHSQKIMRSSDKVKRRGIR